MESKKFEIVAVAKPFEALSPGFNDNPKHKKYLETQNRVRLSAIVKELAEDEKAETKAVYEFIDEERGIILNVWVGENDKFLGIRFSCDIDDKGPTKDILQRLYRNSENIKGIAKNSQQLEESEEISVNQEKI